MPGDDPAWRRAGNTDGYTFSGSDYKVSLKCRVCRSSTRVRSNRACVEEHRRQTAYLRLDTPAVCPTCGSSDRLQKFGQTTAGSTRFRCAGCKKTFSVPINAQWRQRVPEKNDLILKLLVNKSPMRRILEVSGVSATTLYRKLEFAHAQCMRFAARLERQLPTLPLDSVEIGTDRQDFLVNWGRHFDRRAFVLSAIVSAENQSGYVLAAHTNFDPDVDPGRAEREARQRGDYDKLIYEREAARIWLARDYAAHAARVVKESHDTSFSVQRGSRSEAGDAFFDELWETAAPAHGVQVRQEYVFVAHFLTLRYLLGSARTITFYLDPDAGLKQGTISAFRDEILAGRCRAYELDITKKLTIDKVELAVMQAKAALDRARKATPGLSRDKMALQLLARDLEAATDPSAWIRHPLPNRAEPELRVRHLTPRESDTPADLAAQMLKATIRNTDRFMMIVRRRVSLLERPIKTSSGGSRHWYAYSPYNPAVACRLLDIVRVLHNFQHVGKDGKTPGMRLGLTDQPWSIEEILNVPRWIEPVRRPAARKRKGPPAKDPAAG